MNKIESNWFLENMHRTKYKKKFEVVRNAFETDFGIAMIHSNWLPIWNFEYLFIFKLYYKDFIE